MKKTFWEFFFADWQRPAQTIVVLLFMLIGVVLGIQEGFHALNIGWIIFFAIIKTIIWFKIHQHWKKLYKNGKE